MTSGLYRTETSCFLFSDFGRPRKDFSGTISANCFLVRGFASGSAFAAARILALSSAEGIRRARLAEILDIVIHLFALGMAETDDSSNIAPIHKGNVIERVTFGNETDHPDFVVSVPAIDPHERLIPNKLLGVRQRQAVPSAVQPVFGRVKIDEHTIL